MMSIVVPTYNEVENVTRLIPAVFKACDEAGLEVEIVVADDSSPDGTADAAEACLGDRGTVLRRTGPRGLAPAVMDGFRAARGELLGVMDADLSHPPKVLPAMAHALDDPAVDLAVASRYVPGGGVAGWPFKRRLASRVACLMARPLTSIRDATSGFFLFRRAVIDGLELEPRGFKIGLEIYVRGQVRRHVEVPFTFSDRQYGQSKLGGRVMTQYIAQLARLLWWRCFGR